MKKTDVSNPDQLDLFAPEPAPKPANRAPVCSFVNKEGKPMLVTERLGKEDFRAMLGVDLLFLTRDEILDYVAEPELRRTVRAALKDAPLP